MRLRACIGLTIGDEELSVIIDSGVGIGVKTTVVGTMYRDAVKVGDGWLAFVIEMRDVGVIYPTDGVVPLIDIAAAHAIGNRIMNVADTDSLLPQQ